MRVPINASAKEGLFNLAYDNGYHRGPKGIDWPAFIETLTHTTYTIDITYHYDRGGNKPLDLPITPTQQTALLTIATIHSLHPQTDRGPALARNRRPTTELTLRSVIEAIGIGYLTPTDLAPYNPNHDIPYTPTQHAPTGYRVTQLTQEHLIELARAYDYIRAPTRPVTRPRNTVATLITALSLCRYEDMRDPSWQELDVQRIEANLPCFWYDTISSRTLQPELRKRKWYLSLRTQTIDNLLNLANHYHISPLQRTLHQPTRKEYIQATLEAIGQQYLVPIDLPKATHRYYQPSKKYITIPMPEYPIP